MLEYKFPIIKTIDDVLPHIRDFPDIIISEKLYGSEISFKYDVTEDYMVINYMYGHSTTFDMADVHDEGGAMRRECRGLIFDYKGDIASRPLHKFFNIGQREETLPENINLSRPHVIMEKLDGSMIRPLMFKTTGILRLATKMGVTDVACQAEKVLTKPQSSWIFDMVMDDKTPIFEFISPNNKIVIQYEHEELVLLAIRDNFTGKYLKLPTDSPFKVVPMYKSTDLSILDYINKVSAEDGREGDIGRFASGHMFKLKCDLYVAKHRMKEQIQQDRHIAEMIVDGLIDDVLPTIIDDDDKKRVEDYMLMFSQYVDNSIERLKALADIAAFQYGGDKKRVALEMVPLLPHKMDARIIFAFLDGKSVETSIQNLIRSLIGNNTKYESLIEWMKI